MKTAQGLIQVCKLLCSAVGWSSAVCMHVRTHTHTYMHKHAHSCVQRLIHMNAQAYTPTCAYAHTCTWTHTCSHTQGLAISQENWRGWRLCFYWFILMILLTSVQETNGCVAGRGNPFQGPEVGSCLTPRSEFSEEMHMLTEQEILLRKGSQVESRRVRKPRRTALPRGLQSRVLWWRDSFLGCF